MARPNVCRKDVLLFLLRVVGSPFLLRFSIYLILSELASRPRRPASTRGDRLQRRRSSDIGRFSDLDAGAIDVSEVPAGGFAKYRFLSRPVKTYLRSGSRKRLAWADDFINFTFNLFYLISLALVVYNLDIW